MLDFCATHGIVSDIQMIPRQKINEAWERLLGIAPSESFFGKYGGALPRRRYDTRCG